MLPKQIKKRWNIGVTTNKKRYEPYKTAQSTTQFYHSLYNRIIWLPVWGPKVARARHLNVISEPMSASKILKHILIFLSVSRTPSLQSCCCWHCWPGQWRESLSFYWLRTMKGFPVVLLFTGYEVILDVLPVLPSTVAPIAAMPFLMFVWSVNFDFDIFNVSFLCPV